MGIFSKKNEAVTDIETEMSNQAKRLGLSLSDLKNLASGKSCPKYGTAELLHARKVRGGKIVVFNISERYRGEKISEGRKKIKGQPEKEEVASDESDKE